MAQLFDVILERQTAEGAALEVVKLAVQRVFPVDRTVIDAMFARAPTVVKHNADGKTAEQYSQALERAGAKCRIVALVTEPQPTVPKNHRVLEGITQASLEVEPARPQSTPTVAVGTVAVAPTTTPTPVATSTDDEAFAKTAAELKTQLASLRTECERGSGYEAHRKRVMMITGWVGIIAIAVLWIAINAIAGILLGILAAVIAHFMLGGTDRKAKESADCFVSELKKRPDVDEPIFRAVLGEWLAIDGDDASGSRVLRTVCFTTLGTPNTPAYTEAVGRLKSMAAAETARVTEAKAAEKIKQKQEAAGELERQRERALKSAHEVDPQACLPVYGTQVEMHPSVFTSFSGGWRFSVSPNYFLIMPSSGSNGTMKFPMDCVSEIIIRSASEGLSSRAIVSKFLDPAFGQKPMWVRVNLHVWLHWVEKSGGSTTDYNGVSFEISDSEWKVVGDAWQKAARYPFPKAPRCPNCKAHAVNAELSRFSDKIGLSAPTMRATCNSCGVKLIYDTAVGGFQLTQ